MEREQWQLWAGAMNDYTDLHANEEINEPTPPEHEGTDWQDCADEDSCVDYLDEVA